MDNNIISEEQNQEELEKSAGKTINGTTLENHSTDNFADSIISKQIEELNKTKAKEHDFDELSVYYGEDYWIDDVFVITQPTVQDFLDVKEKNIYATIAPFTSNPTSYRVQLWDMDIDWNDLEDFQLFAMLIKTLNIEYSSIMFKRIMTQSELSKYILDWKENNNPTEEDMEKFISELDLKSKDLLQPINFNGFNLYSKKISEDSEETTSTLYDPDMQIELSQDVYSKMSEYVRYMFNSYPEVERCKGKTLKKQLINNDKLKQAQASQESKGSNMRNLISFALNHPGFKYKKNELREVGIVEFMDSIQRLQIYESTKSLMSGMYSGFVDTSKINKNEFNFMRDVGHS